MKTVKVGSSKRNEMVDITPHIQKAVSSSGMEDGVCFVYCPHTTAAVTINEGADPAVKADILKVLDEAVEGISFDHAEGNADSHTKSSIVGPGEHVFVENGELQLGTWQKIFFCEFDGPRSREVWVETGKGI